MSHLHVSDILLTKIIPYYQRYEIKLCEEGIRCANPYKNTVVLKGCVEIY